MRCAPYFEVDAAHLVVAVLQHFALYGRLKASVVTDAIAEFGIDPEREAPFSV